MNALGVAISLIQESATPHRLWLHDAATVISMPLDITHTQTHFMMAHPIIYSKKQS